MFGDFCLRQIDFGNSTRLERKFGSLYINATPSPERFDQHLSFYDEEYVLHCSFFFRKYDCSMICCRFQGHNQGAMKEKQLMTFAIEAKILKEATWQGASEVKPDDIQTAAEKLFHPQKHRE